MASGPRIIFIVGPTASGKTALSVQVAQQLNAEIICADSQTIRKDMNIGTAKPDADEQQGVPHHMLDIIEPYESFSVADFVKQAREIIKDIQERGKLVIVVGGTGLYIDALYYQFDFDAVPKVTTRTDLNDLSVAELQSIISARGLPMPENLQNKRHLTRTLERGGVVGGSSEPYPDSAIVGLDPGRELLVERINKRVDLMFAKGFFGEVKAITQKYGNPPEQFDAIGYRIAMRHLTGEISGQEAKELFKIADRQYAKRQMTWFKRNTDIAWFQDPGEAQSYILKLC